jgi:hypothetical protein
MSAALAMAVSAPGTRPALAQQMPISEGIVGSWIQVSVSSQQADGTRGEPFGSNPKGLLMVSGDGHFSLFQSRSELQRLAANDRTRATAEEAMAIMRDSIAYFGTYATDEASRSLVLNLVGSTYPNLLGGPVQRRIITSLTATELHFTNPRTPSGMILQTVWQRAPVRR